jgi:hypothetical protein
MSRFVDSVALPDSNAIINIVRTVPGRKALTDLGAGNNLKLLEAVRREIARRGENAARNWVNVSSKFLLHETAEVGELAVALGRAHAELFTVTPGAADPFLVATAKAHRGAVVPRVIVSDDQGIHAVCWLEQLTCLPVGAFRRLLGV